MGFFEKEHGTQTLERPKNDSRSDNRSDNRTDNRTDNPTTSSPSLVSHSTPRSASGGDSGRGAIRSGTTFKVRWTNQDGDVLSEYMQTISHTGKPMGMLNVCRPEGWPAGQYKLEVLLNDTPAATMDLDVR
jgi:hypothetical protein